MNWLARAFKLPQVNQVILIIIFAEFIITTASGLINPMFAIFVVEDIKAPIAVVGFAVALYAVIKSIIQLFVARQLDKNHGEVDDYYAMLFGQALLVTAFYLYFFVHEVWQIFALQALLAVADAFIVPPFYAIYTRHIDKEHEAFEWSLRSSFSLGAGTALGGALSGVFASVAGIRPLFLMNGTLMLMAFVVMLFLRPYIAPKTKPDVSAYDSTKRV